MDIPSKATKRRQKLHFSKKTVKQNKKARHDTWMARIVDTLKSLAILDEEEDYIDIELFDEDLDIWELMKSWVSGESAEGKSEKKVKNKSNPAKKDSPGHTFKSEKRKQAAKPSTPEPKPSMFDSVTSYFSNMFKKDEPKQKRNKGH